MINNYKTYPKEFRYDCPPIQKDKCFVIMPFDKELNKVYGNIKAQLEEEGYHCVRADEVAGSTSIMGKILNQMLSSQFVITDITNANPNVFYELGVAHSYKDASNVIIIKEETKECPFDITHLSYITYSNNNMLLLTSKILSTMQEIKYVSDFQDMLNVKGIINYINDSSNRFVEYIVSNYENELPLITNVISHQYISKNDFELRALFEKYNRDLMGLLSNNEIELVNGLLKVYFEMIYSISELPIASQQFSNFILNELYCDNTANDIIDFIIRMVNNNKLFDISMEWIISYFTKPKTTNIDLRRYKIESFLMTSNDERVISIIESSLISNNKCIRESMADIIGERQMLKSMPVLVSALNNENENYVTRSILHAISKINATNAYEIIINWFEKNRKRIIYNKDYFMLNHVKTCIDRTDRTPGKTHLKDFLNTYGKYIN